MEIIYGDYVESFIPNATMQEVLRDGVLYNYSIQAVEGYVLHDKRIDDVETDKVLARFKEGSTTVRSDYNFADATNGVLAYTDKNGTDVTIPVETIGMYEFYTLPVGVAEDYERIMAEQEETTDI